MEINKIMQVAIDKAIKRIQPADIIIMRTHVEITLRIPETDIIKVERMKICRCGYM